MSRFFADRGPAGKTRIAAFCAIGTVWRRRKSVFRLQRSALPEKKSLRSPGKTLLPAIGSVQPGRRNVLPVHGSLLPPRKCVLPAIGNVSRSGKYVLPVQKGYRSHEAPCRSSGRRGDSESDRGGAEKMGATEGSRSCGERARFRRLVLNHPSPDGRASPPCLICPNNRNCCTRRAWEKHLSVWEQGVCRHD